MRQENKIEFKNVKIAILDDEQGIIDSVKVVLKRQGFSVWGTTNVQQCIKELKINNHDIFITDYLMEAMYGDEVVSKIREFDSGLYIIMLTGHKDLAPPIETLLELNIQNYCEKSDDFTSLLLAVFSGYKTRKQYEHILNLNLLGEKLKSLRIAKGYTQEDVANLLFIQKDIISKWENGKRIPSIEMLQNLAQLFDYDFVIK